MRLAWPTVHPYDVGHFVPHGAGRPGRINLFRQERHLNRGWSAPGRAYRWLERYAGSRPGTFYFIRPVYGDDSSDTPRYLEWAALVDADEATRLATLAEWGKSPAIEILAPRSHGAGLELAWLVGWFDNFPPGSAELDLRRR